MLKAIPHAPGPRSACIWIGVVHIDAQLSDSITLEVGSRRVAVAPQAFNSLKFGEKRLHYSFVTIDQLQPATEYSVRALSTRYGEASARVRTLPLALRDETRPLRLLLSSCYCTTNRRSKLATELLRTFDKPHLKPDIHIWSGDQVYLDAPWYRFMLAKHSRQSLEALHAEAYARTFLEDQGLARILPEGANIFCPDDHEYWNNAPDENIVARDSKDPNRRKDWYEIAASLLHAFQGQTAVPLVFDVPPLSFLVLDARSNRAANRAALISDDQLSALRTWLAALKGPGVLITGQPFFDSKTHRHDDKADYHLADFPQYADLMRLLAQCSQSIVVLSGDVHFSRVAQVELENGKTITEVLSSPLAVVTGGGIGASWEEAPSRLDIGGSDPFANSPIKTDMGLQLHDEGAMLLEFYTRGNRVFCSASAWRLRDAKHGRPCFREEYSIGR